MTFMSRLNYRTFFLNIFVVVEDKIMLSFREGIFQLEVSNQEWSFAIGFC